MLTRAHSVITIVTCAVAALALGACKHAPKPAPPSCTAGASHADVGFLQEELRNGTDPCPDLPTPKVALDAHGVSVDNVLVVPPQDVPSGRAQNIAALFDLLQGHRRLWRQIHPGGKFAPLVDLGMSPDESAVAAASVIRSVAWAGFPKMHLHTGDATVDFEFETPRPPGAPQDPGLVRVDPTGTAQDLAKSIEAELAKPTDHLKHAIAFGRATRPRGH